MAGLGSAGLGSFPLGAASGAGLSLSTTTHGGGGGVLLGTDNGFLVKWYGRNDYRVVWAGPDYVGSNHRAFHDAMTPQPAAFNDPASVTALPVFGSVATPLYSQDGGATWTLGTSSEPPGYPGASNPFAGHIPLAKDGTDNWNVDEDGRTWFADSASASPFHRHIFRSPDATGTGLYTDVFDATAVMGTVRFAVYISDGWFWWLAPNGTLHRCDLSGGAHMSWSITFPAGAATQKKGEYALSGWPRTNRLVAWFWGNVARIGGVDVIPPILSIDITDPDNPSFAFSADDPFGVSQLIWDVVPLTNGIVIANAVDDTPSGGDLAGSIWRSADGGVTWANVVSNTPNLGNENFDNEISAVAPSPTAPNEVWCAQFPPAVYHSTDGGLTWDAESVDMTIFDPFLTGGSDVRPQEWTGISAVPGDEFPGLARYPEAGQPARWGPPLVP